MKLLYLVLLVYPKGVPMNEGFTLSQLEFVYHPGVGCGTCIHVFW